MYFYIGILRVCGSYGYITQAGSLQEAKDAVAFWRGKGDIQKALDKGIAIFEIPDGLDFNNIPLPSLLALYEALPDNQATEILPPHQEVGVSSINIP